MQEKIEQIYGPYVRRVNETIEKQEAMLAELQVILLHLQSVHYFDNLDDLFTSTVLEYNH